MTNNDILRRIRYIFDLKDNKMIAIFASGNAQVSRESVSAWLKKEDDPSYINCSDKMLASFLNGFINDKRGKKDGVEMAAENKLTNNLILTKLKIALNLKSDDIIRLMAMAEFVISKPELSALFRKPGHKHYRECKDQFLRNFLQGLQVMHQGANQTSSSSVWKQTS